MNLAACVCIGPCWLGPLAMCRRIQCLLDAIPLWAVLRGRRWCQCSRQVILPRLHSALPPAWPCCSESGSLRIGVRVGSELSGSQRCWGFGHSPGSCPAKEPRRGAPMGAGRETPCPACRDGLSSLLGVAPGVFHPPSSQTTPPNFRQLFSNTFTTSSSPPQPQSPRSNNEEPGAAFSRALQPRGPPGVL